MVDYFLAPVTISEVKFITKEVLGRSLDKKEVSTLHERLSRAIEENRDTLDDGATKLDLMLVIKSYCEEIKGEAS